MTGRGASLRLPAVDAAKANPGTLLANFGGAFHMNLIPIPGVKTAPVPAAEEEEIVTKHH